MNNQGSITLTLKEISALEKAAVQGAKLSILVDDFQEHKHVADKRLEAIDTNIGNVYKLVRDFPSKVSRCQDDLEKDIERLYMSKTSGELMEQRLNNNIRSIKLWIVSSVGGATATGIFIMWFYNLRLI